MQDGALDEYRGFDAVPALYIRLRMAGHDVTAFIDTGAGLSLVSYDFADRLGLIPLADRSTSIEIQGIHQEKQHSFGQLHSVIATAGGFDFPLSLAVVENATQSFIVGIDFMTQHKVVIDFVHGLMRIGTSATVPFLSREQVAEVMQRERQPAHYQRSAHDERDAAGGALRPAGGDPGADGPAAGAAVRGDVLHPRPYLRVHDAALRRLLPRLYMAAGFFNHGRGSAARPAEAAPPPSASAPASEASRPRPPPRVVFQS